MAEKNSEISIFEAAGTVEYYAPELVAKKKYGKAVDWWCIGCLIYEMLTGLPPFYSENKQELTAKIRFGEPKYPDYFSPAVVNLLKGLFKKNPVQRIGTKKGATELKNHVWFKDFKWDDLLDKKLQIGSLNKPTLKSDIDTAYFASNVVDMELSSNNESKSVISEAKTHDPYLGFSWYAEESLLPQIFACKDDSLLREKTMS